MSTANFHNINARFIYACEIEDDFVYEDLITDLRAAFRAAVEDPRTQALAACEEIPEAWETDGLRSYPGRIIAQVESETKSYRDFDIAMAADIIVRSGYYAGVNLDYTIRFQVDGEEFEEDDLDAAGGDSALPGTQRAYRLTLARRWFDRHASAFTAAIEAIFAEYSTPLRTVGRASNGETFYEKA